MSAPKKHDDWVLRGAGTHALPRHLPRSPRHVFAASTPVVHATLGTAPATPGEAGYQEGVELGRAAGLQQGLEGAQRRVDDAVTAARRDFEEKAGRRLQEFQAEANARIGQLDKLLAAFDAATASRIADLEADAIALAYGAVCKVLGAQAGMPAAVAGLVQQALAQLRGSAIIAVRLNERDLRVLMGDEQGRRLKASAPQVEWVTDASVAAGGCLVDTTAGGLDARLETQLSALLGLWRSGATSERSA